MQKQSPLGMTAPSPSCLGLQDAARTPGVSNLPRSRSQTRAMLLEMAQIIGGSGDEGVM